MEADNKQTWEQGMMMGLAVQLQGSNCRQSLNRDTVMQLQGSNCRHHWQGLPMAVQQQRGSQ